MDGGAMSEQTEKLCSLYRRFVAERGIFQIERTLVRRRTRVDPPF